jgi:hypothetical protein
MIIPNCPAPTTPFGKAVFRECLQWSIPVIERIPNVRVKIGQHQPNLAKNSAPSPRKSSSLALAGLG